MRVLIEQQLSDHAELLGDKIVLEGEDIMLKPEAVQNVGMAIHELVVNAAKFGALSTDAGGVDIHWRLSEERPQLDLVWEEHGGPSVKPPARSGFGRAMIENVVGKALDGKVALSFPAQGVQCVISIPASHLVSRAKSI